MRSPFRSFARFATSAVLSLAAVITILLGYQFLSTEVAKYGKLEREQANLRDAKGRLETLRDQLATDLPARIPQPGTPANILAEQLKALELEISNKQAARQKLWDDHPIERMLPASATFRRIAALDIEIGFLRQGLAYLRNLHTVTAGPAEAERQIKSFQTASSKLAEQIYQNQKAQWELSKRQPLLWQVPYSDAYQQMKRWEQEERLLHSAKAQHDGEIARQRRILEELRKLPRAAPFALHPESANHTLQPVHELLAKNDKELEGSYFQKFMRPVKEVLPTALGILALVLLAPLLVKVIAYYVIAPVAVRRPPIRLLPDSSGQLSTAITSAGSESGQTAPSRVSLPLTLDEGSELIMLPSYLQGMPLNAESDTQWLLDWSMPLTCLAAGTYRLTRIRPHSEARITVSSSTDPLAEFSLLDVPAGSALVLQPSCLVGIIQTRGEQLKITSHWHFARLGAWLTLQFRYIVFHGPAKLIVKGCRGVRVEPTIAGRTVNQAATLGFSANLDYSVARNETFWSYFFGERELFNDSWQGKGCCVHAETPHPGDRSGLFGRGIQGIGDTILKTFGI
ncbi:MAG: hypothetical protein CVU34_12265 [Betaproteobacteria bacterium HGW-Betaproteobacteria-7]|nr:MAG: hypothetical protein CVU34_12265 [Betaproteobacteria bacterium HGW-Betaproteobacteria-7]